MLNVITLPSFIPHEADAIVEQFRQRHIDYLHLRKPGADEERVEALLNEIPREYYSRIVMHDFHVLALKYDVGGIHLTSRNPNVPDGWRGRVSTSCHSLEELVTRKREGFRIEGIQRHFNYLTLSPIFDSISKKGYYAAFKPEQIAEARSLGIIDQSVLALGGVTFERLKEVEEMGFGGAMILGDAWKSLK